MIIFIRDINKLITAVEGTGDNLTKEDEDAATRLLYFDLESLQDNE